MEMKCDMENKSHCKTNLFHNLLLLHSEKVLFYYSQIQYFFIQVESLENLLKIINKVNSILFQYFRLTFTIFSLYCTLPKLFQLLLVSRRVFAELVPSQCACLSLLSFCCFVRWSFIPCLRRIKTKKRKRFLWVYSYVIRIVNLLLIL